MTPTFTRLAAWASYPRLSMRAFRAQFPLAGSDGWHGEGDEDDSEFEVILVTGNLSLTQDEYLEILRDPARRLAVDGDLQVEGRVSGVFFVSGDLHCHSVLMSWKWRDDAVRGRILASDCVCISSDDRGARRVAPVCRIETRFLFCWFYEIGQVELNAAAVVFILADWDDSHNLDVPNQVVVWHDTVHVLAVECRDEVTMADSDQPSWDFKAIEAALRAGRSIYQSGFDIGCYPVRIAADDALSVGDLPLAYGLYRQAAAISPAYYPAWFGMADAFWFADAFEQALAASIAASKKFPEDECGLMNDAAVLAARCALLLRRLPLAREMAGVALDHVARNWVKVRGTAPAYRMRAEAHLLDGQLDAAQADLELALEDEPWHDISLWLMGLVHFLRGEHERAQHFHARAVRVNPDLDAAYEDEANTDFLDGEACRVDWDRQDAAVAAAPPRDEAYWRTFMARNESAKIIRVPQHFRSTAMLQDMLDARSEDDDTAWQGDVLDFLEAFPAQAFTPALARAAVARSPHNLKWVPRALIDKAVCLRARRGTGGFALAHVAAQCIDYEVALRAAECGESIANVPPQLVDKALCLAAIMYQPSALDDVPAALIDDDLIAAAIAFGTPWHLESQMPAMYTSVALLERAIDQYKRALDAISGTRFDAHLYQHALRRYGQDSDWDQIVARHSPALCDAQPRTSCAEVCWSAFWDEAFILRQVAGKSNRLSPWQIPDACFTQAIANACAKRDRIHLDTIPLRFVHQAMCNAFSKEYPGMLGHVPVAYRSAAICRAAVKKDPANLALVPLAQRNVDLCVVALLASETVECDVPSPVHRAVFERLIARHAGDFEPGFLYLSRAERAVCRSMPEIDAAMADCATVRARKAGSGFTRDDKAQARFVQGYCHFLRGEPAKAARLHPGDDWPAYEDVHFDEPSEPVDFNKGKFDTIMRDLDRLTQARDYRRALAAVEAGERMLADAGSRDACFWAQVLDKKRFLAYELGEWDLNETACHQIIERLQHQDLWLFSAFMEPLRAALRSAWFRLGTMHAGADRSAGELKADLALIDKALALFYSDEDDEVIAPFKEGRATVRALLDAASA
ncbi:tetratricopeptide repeat protein [Massilia aquatica]|uniref:Tetratricopeptide repeat protein n=1 Tax=Massilia aquatica TaxID=2609000 RepID=A0ABX0LX75_9BURK|nr:tetratricopeptide repeat protein [Massilia aquatica]NHZ39431.1 tetratricopeptide repeat protein [Massilia aquatica]